MFVWVDNNTEQSGVSLLTTQQNNTINQAKLSKRSQTCTSTTETTWTCLSPHPILQLKPSLGFLHLDNYLSVLRAITTSLYNYLHIIRSFILQQIKFIQQLLNGLLVFWPYAVSILALPLVCTKYSLHWNKLLATSGNSFTALEATDVHNITVDPNSSTAVQQWHMLMP